MRQYLNLIFSLSNMFFYSELEEAIRRHPGIKGDKGERGQRVKKSKKNDDNIIFDTK